MRRLSALFIEYKKVCENAGKQVTNSSDMLWRGTFEELKYALCQYTTGSGEEVKAGLIDGLYILVKNFCKVIRGYHLVGGRNAAAAEITNFVDVFEVHKPFVFGDARYILKKNRQTNLRKPCNLPVENDVTQIRDYIISRTDQLVNDSYMQWDAHKYAELRDLTVSRLTLFNARRGGEPARLTIREWQEAEADA